MASSCPRRVFRQLSERQRVGQLFVAGVSSTAPTRGQRRLIGSAHLGGVILTGGSSAGVTHTRHVSSLLQRRVSQRSTGGVKLWVAADQEGGYVQALKGPGFAQIPTALTQGTWSVPALRSRAHHWGRQLHGAGVNLDLAPVLDTVPARLGTANKPIGYYHREYGHRPRHVARHGLAFGAGIRSAQVEITAKHFPGLGRVRANTDTTAHVTDRVTTRHDPYLLPFQRAIAHTVDVVMVSSARYQRIDKHRIAAFSPTVLRGMLRSDLGYRGVIMSDDLGSAAAVSAYPLGVRAVRFLRSGGTVVLSVDSATVAPMVTAVVAHLRDSRAFRRQVNADALSVLRTKHRIGLLPC